METFIKLHEYNHIKKYLRELNNTFRGCVDTKIVETCKSSIQDKILALFTDLSEEQKKLLDITLLTDSLYIDAYLADLNQYIHGMPTITNAQLNKLFKKEKKLKLPDQTIYDSKLVYLGWIDESLRKLFIVYNMDSKWVGMACRIPNATSNNTHMCALCNHVGDANEVAFVSPVCKTSENNYRSIGFNICLDSQKCNERIICTEKLENLLKNVNNIK